MVAIGTPRFKVSVTGVFSAISGKSGILLGIGAGDRRDSLDAERLALTMRRNRATLDILHRPHPLRSAYMRSVVAVQAPRLPSSSSQGRRPGIAAAARLGLVGDEAALAEADIRCIGRVAPILAMAWVMPARTQDGVDHSVIPAQAGIQKSQALSFLAPDPACAG